MNYYQSILTPKFQEIIPNMFLPPLKMKPLQSLDVHVSHLQMKPLMAMPILNLSTSTNSATANQNHAASAYGSMIQNAEANSTSTTDSSSDNEGMYENAQDDTPEKKDLKERNRVAAQKWRQKKDKYLGELEEANDVLRKQALELCGSMQSLKVENKLLEDELQFFQSFMSKIMHVGPR